MILKYSSEERPRRVEAPPISIEALDQAIVRVAHALKILLGMTSAFASGALSYSKVRALTRVAGPHNENELIAFALRATTLQVEERCRELRCGMARSLDDAKNGQARRSLRIHRDENRGTMTFTLELPLETGALVERAVDRARDSTLSESSEIPDESWSARQADAMVDVANAYLSCDGQNGNVTSDNYQVTVHVDQSALAGKPGRAGLPIESVKRLCCDGKAIVLVEDDKGEPLSIGRKSRVVPLAIKRALESRDKGCVFPGCHRHRFVDAHHVKHWSAGGETSLENLVLLCSQHHRLVHEGGFSIEKDFRNRWFFRRADGRAVPACGYRKSDTVDSSTGDVDAFLSKLHKHPSREGLLSNMEKVSGAPPPST